jgi:hypothetical protein
VAEVSALYGRHNPEKLVDVPGLVRGERDRGVHGASLELPGPVLTHLRAVYINRSEAKPDFNTKI